MTHGMVRTTREECGGVDVCTGRVSVHCVWFEVRSVSFCTLMDVRS
jgi:hypothetical protein